MRAFAREHQLAVLAVEGGAPVEKLLDALRALLDEDAGGFGIDQAVASGERVFEVEGDVFVAAHGDGDASLGVGGVGFGELFFGDDEHGACTGEADGRAEAGDSCADDEKIDLLRCWITDVVICWVLL